MSLALQCHLRAKFRQIGHFFPRFAVSMQLKCHVNALITTRQAVVSRRHYDEPGIFLT